MRAGAARRLGKGEAIVELASDDPALARPAARQQGHEEAGHCVRVDSPRHQVRQAPRLVPVTHSGRPTRDHVPVAVHGKGQFRFRFVKRPALLTTSAVASVGESVHKPGMQAGMLGSPLNMRCFEESSGATMDPSAYDRTSNVGSRKSPALHSENSCSLELIPTTSASSSSQPVADAA
jgi:hypothetical protein